MDAISSFIQDFNGENIKILSHPEVQEIRDSISNFIELLHTDICKKSNIYTGKLIISTNSAFDQFNFDEAANEFDYNIELNQFAYNQNFTLKPSTFDGIRSEWRTPSGSPIFKKLYLTNNQFAKKWNSKGKIINVGTKDQPECILSQEGVKEEFLRLIEECIVEINLPKFITIIGITNKRGSAVSINCKWSGRKFQELSLNINISLAIEIPADVTPFKPLELFPDDHFLHVSMEEYVRNKYGYVAVFCSNPKDAPHCWRLSSDYLESFILQRACDEYPRLKTVARFMSNGEEHFLKIKKENILTDAEVPMVTRTAEEMFSATKIHELNVIQMKKTPESINSSPSSTTIFDKFSNEVLMNIILHVLRKSDHASNGKMDTGSTFIGMVNYWYHASKEGFIQDFFTTNHKIKLPLFRNSYTTLASHLLLLIKNIMDRNDVSKYDRMIVWNKMREIYEDLQPILNLEPILRLEEID